MSQYDDDDISGSDADADAPSEEEGVADWGDGGEPGHDGASEGDADMSSDRDDDEGGGDQGAGGRRKGKRRGGDALLLPGGVAAGEDVTLGNADTAVLQLEVSALLSEVRVDYSRVRGAVDGFVAKLKQALISIPEHQVPGRVATGFLQALGAQPQELTLAFKPPSSVTVVGSYALHTMAQPDATVDVAVQIPDECLFKKAHLNYRYHARRALYLAAIASRLASSPDPTLANAQQELCSASHDPTRPALLLHLPASPLVPGFCVRLLPVPSPQLFAASKLAPSRNSVRWVTKRSPPTKIATPATPNAGTGTTNLRTAAGTMPANTASVPLATPQYNAAVLSDAACTCHAAYLSSVFSAHPSLADGVVLLKAWARQRGLLGRDGGLDGHLLTMLVAHLVQQGKLAPGSSALQVLRHTLLALVDPAAGFTKGIAMARSAPAACAPLTASCPAAVPPSHASFRQYYPTVFVDVSGWVNLAARVSASAAAEALGAARRTLALLQSPADADEAFAAALLSRHSPAAAFDYLWRFSLPEVAAGPSVVGSSAAGGKQVPAGGKGKGTAAASGAKGGAANGAAGGDDESCAGSCLVGDQALSRQQEKDVETLVRRALGDRATLVRALGRRLAPGQAPGSTLARGLPALEAGGQLLVAAHVDPAKALRLVDVGPAADDTVAAAQFRAFWGERSELRRFQDGRICEAVMWQCGPSERHHAPDLAVTAAATTHLPAGTCITCCSGALDPALDAAAAPSTSPHGSANGHPAASAPRGRAASAALTSMASTSAPSSSSRLIEAAAEKLGKQLRALEGTALKVTSFQPLSSILRQTCVFFPEPHPLAGGAGAAGGGGRAVPRCMEAIEVLVQLESSGRWPDDPVAFAKTKAALGLQLATALETAHGYKALGSEEYVDVLVDGFAFRLLFHSARDEAMLEKQQPQQQLQQPATASSSSPSSAPTPSRPPPLVRSWHHSLVSFVAGAHPAYVPSVRLAKRWLGCQLLSNHFGEEVTELLVAAVFAGPSALPPPASRHAGFLRFLYLLSSFPWGARPLVVDPEHQIAPAQRQQLLRSYSRRKEAAEKLHAAVGAAGAASRLLDVPALFLATPKDTESVHWTAVRPSRSALQYAAALASKALRLLCSLTEQGALPLGAPQGTGRAAPPAEAWMAAFVPALGAFDVLLLLREEAAPLAQRTLPQLAALLAPSLAAASAPLKRKKGGQEGSGGGGGGVAGVWPVRAADCLTAEEQQHEGPPPKRCRVFLRAFPDKVAASRSPAHLLPELLIGFDPVSLLLEALTQRFGHLAEFGADLQGGCRAVSVKWRPEAFLPAPIKANLAHALLPCHLTSSGRGPLLCVPNLIQVLAEMKELGQGLVEDAVAPPTCRMAT